MDILIHGAGSGEIWGPDIEDLALAGITKEDVEKLAMLDWYIMDEEYLYRFV